MKTASVVFSHLRQGYGRVLIDNVTQIVVVVVVDKVLLLIQKYHDAGIVHKVTHRHLPGGSLWCWWFMLRH